MTTIRQHKLIDREMYRLYYMCDLNNELLYYKIHINDNKIEFIDDDFNYDLEEYNRINNDNKCALDYFMNNYDFQYFELI